MGSRNVLTVLIVIFVAVLLYNALYFTGVVGGFGAPDTVGELPRDERFDVPGLERDAPVQPRPSGPRRPAAEPAPTVEPRSAVAMGDLSLAADWGRNPFLTPREIWAVDNYRPYYASAPPTPPEGLRVTAIVTDSTGRRAAVINNEIVARGDVISGWEVVDFHDDAVVFHVQGRRHVVRMADSAVRLSTGGPAGGRH